MCICIRYPTATLTIHRTKPPTVGPLLTPAAACVPSFGGDARQKRAGPQLLEWTPLLWSEPIDVADSLDRRHSMF
jgi:hypothetical protein